MITAGRHTFVPEDVACNVDLEIGAFCSIASGFKVISGQHPNVEYPECVSSFPFYEHKWGDYPPSKPDGKVTIGSDVWICEDVSILEGVKVHDGAVLAACSVVTRDVPPYTLAAGNPAEFKSMRFSRDVINALLDIQWWNWSDEKIKRHVSSMSNVHDFLDKVSRGVK